MNESDAKHFAEALHQEGLQSLTTGNLIRNFYHIGFLEIVIQACQQPIYK